jgi:hypothetical protein
MHLMEEPNGQPVEDFEIFKGKSWIQLDQYHSVTYI